MTTTTCHTCRGTRIIRNPKTLKWVTCPDCKPTKEGER